MTTFANDSLRVDDATYHRRIRAWVIYDWANSAFATTILAGVLPVYYSQVAGATLPSEAAATGYWSIGLSISLFISAILSPILGTISDITRGKKRFLAIFSGLSIVFTGLLVLVGTGDWLLASGLFIVARIGFVAAITFYDSLLPHVARPRDQDRVSAQGYAVGYLGGGILLVINILMIQFLPGTWGPRLSFLSVAVWWALFSIPLFRHVPEPHTATEKLKRGESSVGAGFRRLMQTVRDISRYRELFKFLLAFLIYSDGIGTIIALATIYGAELGLGTIELVGALLLTQIIGVPFSLIFGRLPGREDTRRSFYTAFIVFNLIALPVVGLNARALLPETITGVPQAAQLTGAAPIESGHYPADTPGLTYSGDWTPQLVTTAESGAAEDTSYQVARTPGAQLEFAFTGQEVELITVTGPQNGIWSVAIDGQTVLDTETGTALEVDTYSPTPRFGVTHTFSADAPGDHTLTVTSLDRRNEASGGNIMALGGVVLPDVRQSSLLTILGLIAAIQIVGLIFAATIGKSLFARLADTLDTRRSIILALVVYSVVAIWGFLLVANVEFWFLAWMIAIVQGGTQALSRSLYASMSPASKSGEFFGLYGVMEKFSSILGPLLFALGVALFNSSRPAILSLILFFIVGGYLLTKINVAEGQRVAQAEDAALAQ